MPTDMYKNLAQAIVKEQEVIIGDIAWREAQKVEGLSVRDKQITGIEGDGSEVLQRLVGRYERLFGRASIEVCRTAVHPFAKQLTEVQLPKILQ